MAPTGTRTITINFDGNVTGLVLSSAKADKAIGKVGSNTSGLKKASTELDAFGNKLDKTAKNSEKSGSLIGGAIALGLTAAAPLVASALVGGVALGTIGVAALIQKNNEDVKESFGDLKNQVVDEMQGASDQVVPYLVKAGHALQQEFANLGPQLHEAFSFAGPDITILTAGVDNFADNAMPGLVNSMRNSKPIIQGTANVLGDLGTTATIVLDSVSSHSDEFGHDISQVGTTVEDLGGVVAGVLPGLANGFGTTVGAADNLLKAVKPIAPALGSITGYGLPVIGMFKLFGAASGPIDRLGGKIGSLGSKLAVTGGISRTTASRLNAAGKAVSGLGSALPFIGIGIGLVTSAISASDQKFQQWQADLLQGGDAAKQAMSDFKTVAFVPGSFQRLFDGLTTGQKTLAIYNAEVNKFGPNSRQAATASRELAAANAEESARQEATNRAMMTSNQLLSAHVTSLIGAASADLDLQGATNSVSDAQDAYAAAVKKSGKNSQDAKTASLSLQQALIAEVNAAGAAAAANDKNATDAQKAKDSTAGQTAAVLGLVQKYSAAGTAIPGALSKIAGGLNKTQVQAAVTTGQVEGVTRSLNKLPSGKSTTVKALTSQAISDLRAVGDKVTHLPNGQFSITAADHATATINKIIANNNGRRITLFVNTQNGTVRASGTTIAARAKGGPALAGTPYVVGDGGGPEIFVPNESGHVIGTRESADILSGGGGDTFTLEFAGEVLAQIIDGRLVAHNRTLIRKVRAGATR